MSEEDRSAAMEFHASSKISSFFRFHKAVFKHHFSDSVLKMMQDASVDDRFDEVINLPPPSEINMTLLDAIHSRTSSRGWIKDRMSLRDLHALLFYSFGVTSGNPTKRFTPSAGGLSSVKAHLICNNVVDLSRGLYSYNPRRSELGVVAIGDFERWAERHVLFQESFSRASVIIILESDMSKLLEKYGAKGYRLAAMDVGVVCQQLYLVSAGLGLGICATAGIFEQDVSAAFGFDDRKSVPALALGCGPVSANT